MTEGSYIKKLYHWSRRISQTIKRRIQPSSFVNKAVAVFLLVAGFSFLVYRYSRQIDFVRMSYLTHPVKIEVEDREYEGRWSGAFFSQPGHTTDTICRFKTPAGSRTQLSILDRGVLVLAGKCEVTIYPNRANFFFVKKGNVFFRKKIAGRTLDATQLLATPLRFTLFSTTRKIYQGKTLLFKIKADKRVAKVKAYFLNRRVNFFSVSGSQSDFVAIQGVDVWQRAGDKLLTVRCVNGKGDWLLRAFRLKVAKKRYYRRKRVKRIARPKKRIRRNKRQRVHLANWWRKWRQKKKYLLSGGRPEREYKMLQKIYTTVSSNRRWRGGFAVPMRRFDRISSAFGIVRYLSFGGGSPHRGIDYASKNGAEVRAAAAGKVVFAKYTPVRGNLVIIDHGYGVFTSYFHMNAICVRKGARVWKGQPVGAVGNTGLSTGPHLHFEVRAGNVCVDPGQWFTSNILFRFAWRKMTQNL